MLKIEQLHAHSFTDELVDSSCLFSLKNLQVREDLHKDPSRLNGPLPLSTHQSYGKDPRRSSLWVVSSCKLDDNIPRRNAIFYSRRRNGHKARSCLEANCSRKTEKLHKNMVFKPLQKTDPTDGNEILEISSFANIKLTPPSCLYIH